MVATQVIVSMGQFAYSAVTARVFTPTEFGAFAAALSLQALLVLLTTTGLPSLVLKESILTSPDIRAVRTYAVTGGAVAAIVFWLASPAWLDLLNSPSGIVYVPWLAAALCVGPVCAVESSLLRREGRSIADSLTFVLAFAVPAVVAVVAALTARQSWALAIVSVLSPVVLGASSAIARRERYSGGERKSHRGRLAYAWRVSTQNVAFLLIGQAPSWAVSGVLGASALGQYSRASTLAGMPSTALSTGLSRALQPHWRKLVDNRTTAKAIRDAVTLTACLAFPAFAILAAIGPDLSTLWLGPGWEGARDLVPLLAIAFGFQVPFGVLATSLEMRGIFAPVRLAQVGLAVGLGLGLGLFILTRDARFAAAAAALSQVVGLLVLLGVMATSSHLPARSLYSSLSKSLVWAAAIGGCGFAGVEIARVQAWTILGSDELAAVLTGATMAGFAWGGTFRWQPVNAVLVQRGVRLPLLMPRPG